MARPTRKLVPRAKIGRAFLCAKFELNVCTTARLAELHMTEVAGGAQQASGGRTAFPEDSRKDGSDWSCNVAGGIRLLTWLLVESSEGWFHWAQGCWSGRLLPAKLYWFSRKSWWLCRGVQCLYRVITVSFPLCDQFRHLCEGRNSHEACAGKTEENTGASRF